MRQTLLFIALCATLAAAVVVAKHIQQDRSSWADPVAQWAAIKFSHKYHIENFEIECVVCHTAAEASESATDLLLPKKAVCADCHNVEDESECKLCHVNPEQPETFAAPEREVRFNHKQHLEQQQIKCADCHAGVEMAEAATLASLPTMATCTACHNNVQATSACESCHNHVETLLPLSHREADWRRQHKRLVRVDSPANDCQTCHTDNFCQQCHAEATTQLTRGAPERSVSENRPAASGTQQLVKPLVHDLNFVFNHGIELRAKQADCFSCHNQQTFCSDCHARNQDAGFAAPFPLTHYGNDFVRLGVGSGGGRHAELARRDMESCASCHDLEGSDPSCITCHIDRTPGMGNDPSTHSPSQISRWRSERGDWHDDQNSTCYNCHINTNQAGIGFCGYCHGMK